MRHTFEELLFAIKFNQKAEDIECRDGKVYLKGQHVADYKEAEFGVEGDTMTIALPFKPAQPAEFISIDVIVTQDPGAFFTEQSNE